MREVVIRLGDGRAQVNFDGGNDSERAGERETKAFNFLGGVHFGVRRWRQPQAARGLARTAAATLHRPFISPSQTTTTLDPCAPRIATLQSWSRRSMLVDSSSCAPARSQILRTRRLSLARQPMTPAAPWASRRSLLVSSPAVDLLQRPVASLAFSSSTLHHAAASYSRSASCVRSALERWLTEAEQVEQSQSGRHLPSCASSLSHTLSHAQFRSLLADNNIFNAAKTASSPQKIPTPTGNGAADAARSPLSLLLYFSSVSSNADAAPLKSVSSGRGPSALTVATSRDIIRRP